MNTNNNESAAGAPSPTTSNQPSHQGTRSSRQNRNNRNTRGARQQNIPRNDYNAHKALTNFKGAEKSMNGHVYQLYGEAAHQNQFTRTTQELIGYIGTNFKKPSYIMEMVTSLTETVFVKPDYPENTADAFQVKVWDRETDKYDALVSAYKDNKTALYTLVWGQCSEPMQAKIKTTNEYDIMAKKYNSLQLLIAIKGISYKFESQGNIHITMLEAKINIYTYQQGHDESNTAYLNKFENMIQIAEHYGGSIGEEEALVNDSLKNINKTINTATEVELEAAKK